MGPLRPPAGESGLIGYRSTASKSARVEGFRAALFAGQPADGGLFLPERVPALDLARLRSGTFSEHAAAALEPWFEDEIAPPLVAELCRAVFDFPVPVVPLEPDVFLLELFHGPSAAFKDFGARFMARAAAALREPEAPLTVLVATSGDTGAAVARAFTGLARTRVVLLYPAGRVSPLQELQLTAVPEEVTSFRVEGTFDDCQAMVRTALANGELVAKLGLVAANSINVGRLLPQITYYVHASAELAAAGPAASAAMPGRHRLPPQPEHPLVVVPSGNLGNLTAGLLARMQGAPIRRLLAATNRNDVFVRYLTSGRRRPQPAVATPSNAMDVGNPSNLERIRGLYPGDRRRLRRDVAAESIDDESTLAAMRRVYEEHGRFVCPHTAVALAALRLYRVRTRDRAPAIVLATAHPAKFGEAVRAATGQEIPLPPALQALERLRRPARPLRADPAALVAFLHRMS